MLHLHSISSTYGRRAIQFKGGYGIVYHTHYKAKCRFEHLKLKLNNIYHLFRSDNVIDLLLYHATMVIEFDCIVVTCALLFVVTFLLFLFVCFFCLSYMKIKHLLCIIGGQN